MKQLTIGILFVIFFFKTSIAQSHKAGLIAGGGISFIGTGDLNGFAFVNEVDLYLSKRIFLSPGLQFTNYSKIYNLTYFQVRYITSGINLYTNFNYLLLNRSRHRVAFGVGPSLRFQSTSVPSLLGSDLNSSGEHVLILKYDEPMRTISPGYNISPSYYYQFSKKLFLGAKFILNNDTRGDINSSGLLFVGVTL